MSPVRTTVVVALIGVSFLCFGMIPKDTEDQDDLYPYEGKYIDLEVMMIVKPAGSVEANFKTSSKYAFRFTAPSAWLNNFYTERTFQGVEFNIEDDGKLVMTDKQGREKKVEVLMEGDAVDNVVGGDFLVAVPGGIIRITRYEKCNNYVIKEFDSTGTKKWETTVEHTEITIDGNTYYHHPYLYYFGCTPSTLVFTSGDRDRPATVTVNLNDGKATKYDFSIAGFIRDEDESNVPGFILLDEKREKMTCMLLNLKWSVPMKDMSWNRAEVLMKGEVLYVSLYHGISSGSALFAFNRSTGEMLWQADVKQLNIPHSEYYNTVLLSSFKNRIILEGIEAEGHYVQIFDEKTGERLFSTF